jgi:hypothetical protein
MTDIITLFNQMKNKKIPHSKNNSKIHATDKS